MRRLAKTVQWKVYLWSPLGRTNRGVLSLYGPPFFALLVNWFSDVGMSYLVTCIPLDAPVRSENSQTRPPWIRPVRKKRDSVARNGGGPGSSSDSQHGSPEGSSPPTLLCAYRNFVHPKITPLLYPALRMMRLIF